MKYRVLLADADGTLFDFYKGEAIAVREMFTRFGFPTDDRTISLYSECNEAQWKKLERGETTQAKLRVDRFVEFLKVTGLEGDPEELSEAYIEHLGQQRWPLPYSIELCKNVSEKMPIYLVTNGIARIQRSRFSQCEISDYVKDLVISEEVGKSKPDPAMLFESLRREGLEPKDAIMLGDSVTADIGAANNAGIDCILFTNGKDAPENHGATYCVKTLNEAEEIILK